MEIDFVFDKLTRIEQDNTALSQKNIANTTHANYMLFNPYDGANCWGGTEFATRQPNVNFRSASVPGPLGCNVLESDHLRRSIMTNPNVKINLQQRSYLTVPYLAKGNVDVGQENELRWGDTFKEKKSMIRMSEMQTMDLSSFPLRDPDIVKKRGTLDTKWSYGINTRDAYKGGYCNDKKKKS